jgi:hypothetical protein
MSFAQKIAHSVVDMPVNGLIRWCKRAMAEVSRPTAQKAIESRANLRPRALVAWHQQVADFRLDPLHASLRRRRTQIPTTTVAEMAWSKRIAKEIEAFPSGVLHRGFRLVERQPKFRHHRLRPRQSLVRVSAAEDDEIVG